MHDRGPHGNIFKLIARRALFKTIDVKEIAFLMNPTHSLWSKKAVKISKDTNFGIDKSDDHIAYHTIPKHVEQWKALLWPCGLESQNISRIEWEPI